MLGRNREDNIRFLETVRRGTVGMAFDYGHTFHSFLPRIIWFSVNKAITLLEDGIT